MKRLFIGIKLPELVREELTKAQAVLRKARYEGTLSEAGNLHLTLRFLGEVDESIETEVLARLQKIRGQILNLKIGSVGMFESYGRPRVVWIALAGPGLYELKWAIDDALNGLFPGEDRFVPHVTIARIQEVQHRGRFVDVVSRIKPHPHTFSVSTWELIESHLEAGGARYETVAEFSLAS